MVSPLLPADFTISLVPINRENLKDQLVGQIKNLMFSHKIRVGQKLPSERDLAMRFKVSRVVVREALKSLQQSGLVEIRTGKAGGAYAVSDLHIPFFYAVYDLMSAGQLSSNHFWEFGEIIERTGARLAARNATREDVELLGSLNRKLIEDGKDPNRLLLANRDFHLAVAQVSGNPLIRLTVNSLFKMHDILSSEAGYPSRLTKAISKRHEGIISAIVARDEELSEQLMADDAKEHERFMVADSKNRKNQND
jgi:GntR family transcriptional regulator, transcriptional repressor for pyruvate dehydrogenase complex